MILLEDLVAATHGELICPGEIGVFAAFCFDSRIAHPGELFLAIRTETGDGHDYVLDAISAGATGVVCERVPDGVPANVACLLVGDTQQALLDYARYVLRCRGVQVVGVTGTVGKTSTKEAVAAVLATGAPTFCNYGNYSGRFGLPISLGTLGDEHQVVLEMACDSLDEIKHLVDMTSPRVGIVTNTAEAHLDVFGTLDRIAEEHGALVQALPSDGWAILNGDDAYAVAIGRMTHAQVLTYGRSPSADMRLLEANTSRGGTDLRLSWRGTQHILSIPFVGRHHAYTAMAAALSGIVFGRSMHSVQQGLAALEPLHGRTCLLAGLRDAEILDDSYDACPASVRSALAAAADLPAQRHIVVLGDMTGLGQLARDRHQEAGRACAGMADILIAQGEMSQIVAEAAVGAGMRPDAVLTSFTAQDTVRLLKSQVGAGDLVLVKGGVQSRMETVVAELLEEPGDAQQSLARQTPGWRQVRVYQPGRPTWIEVDLDAIANNVRRILAAVGGDVLVMAVLKADGYGHGAVKVARTALNNGATWLGVACVGEAIHLRQNGIDAPILVLGYTPPWQARDAVLHGLAATVYSVDVARALSRAAGDLGRVARAHIKVDTGMGRLGLLPDQVGEFLSDIDHLPGLEMEGIFTHFSDADAEDLTYTRLQLDRFRSVLSALAGEGRRPRLVHAANSAALFRVPMSRFDMVRPGIAIYGLAPSADAPLPSGFAPALRFKCQVAQVKNLPTGAYVSYGRTFQATRPSRLAVIPVGYADGFRRGPRHWGNVLVRGQRAPIVGRVCMDQTVIDVTDVPGVREGDEVVLIGSQGSDRISVEQVAERLGTINYEVVSEILARVPRVV